MILRTHDSLTKEACIGAYLFSKQVVRLVRKSGFLFTSLYLKQCSSSLQMAYGGIPKPPELLPVPVSLNRSGYPRIIPRFHRRMMMRKDDRADVLVKLYLSLSRDSIESFLCVLVIRNGFSNSFLLSSLVIQVLVSVNKLTPLFLVPGTSQIVSRFMAC